jgi:hypothetical protein
LSSAARRAQRERIEGGEVYPQPNGRAKPRPDPKAKPMHSVWRGHLICPSNNGSGWMLREVAIPTEIVESYAVDRPSPSDVRPVIAARAKRFFDNPELVRKWYEAQS